MSLTLVQGSSPGAWGSATNGTVATDPVAVTWASARTAGSLLLLAANSDSTLTTPTGWTLDQSQVNNSGLYLWWRISDNSATDAPSLDNNASTAIAWAEYTGNTATPSDVSTSSGTAASAATAWSTGTTGTTAQADELAVALWGSSKNFATGALGTWGSETNSFTEQVDVATTKTSGTNAGLAVATKALAATGTVESSATPSVSCARVGLVGTYKAAAASAVVPSPYYFRQLVGSMH